VHERRRGKEKNLARMRSSVCPGKKQFGEGGNPLGEFLKKGNGGKWEDGGGTVGTGQVFVNAGKCRKERPRDPGAQQKKLVLRNKKGPETMS